MPSLLRSLSVWPGSTELFGSVALYLFIKLGESKPLRLCNFLPHYYGAIFYPFLGAPFPQRAPPCSPGPPGTHCVDGGSQNSDPPASASRVPGSSVLRHACLRPHLLLDVYGRFVPCMSLHAVRDCCESPCGCRELNPDPLEQQPVLLAAEPSPQTPHTHI